MDPAKVELSENAVSYALEVDPGDLRVDETLESRYERYSIPEDPPEKPDQEQPKTS
jgi:hypothetical protein